MGEGLTKVCLKVSRTVTSIHYFAVISGFSCATGVISFQFGFYILKAVQFHALDICRGHLKWHIRYNTPCTTDRHSLHSYIMLLSVLSLKHNLHFPLLCCMQDCDIGLCYLEALIFVMVFGSFLLIARVEFKFQRIKLIYFSMALKEGLFSKGLALHDFRVNNYHKIFQYQAMQSIIDRYMFMIFLTDEV